MKHSSKIYILIPLLLILITPKIISTEITPWYSERTLYTLSQLNNMTEKLIDTNYSYIGFSPVITTYNGTILGCLGGSNGGDFGEVDNYLMKSYNNGRTWTAPVPFLDGILGFSDQSYICCTFCWSRLKPTQTHTVTLRENDLSTKPAIFERIWCLVTIDFPDVAYTYATYSDDRGTTWKGIHNSWLNTNEVLNISSTTNIQQDFNAPRSAIFFDGLYTSSGRVIFFGFGMNDRYFGFCIWSDNTQYGLNSTWYHSNEIGDNTLLEGFNPFISGWNMIELSNHTGYATFRSYYGGCGGIPGDCFNSLLQGYAPNLCRDTLTVSEPLTILFEYFLKEGLLCRWNNLVTISDSYFHSISYSDDECQTWSTFKTIGLSCDILGKPLITKNNTALMSIMRDNQLVKLVQFNQELLIS